MSGRRHLRGPFAMTAPAAGRLATRVRSARSALFDILVTGMVALSAVLALGPAPTHARWRLQAIGLGMAMALLARRRFPLSVMAVVSALALLQVLLYPPGFDPLVFDIALLIAMYSVVKYAPRLLYALLAAVPVAIGIIVEVVRHAKTTGQVVSSALFLTAICSGAWLTGYTIRTRRLFVAGLEERAVTAERERDQLARLTVADERAAIARELHDVVAHSLSVMIVQADGASYAVDRDPRQAGAAIRQVAATGRDALEDMRRLVGVLRGTGAVDGPGDGPADDGSADDAGSGRTGGPDTARSEPARRRIGIAELPTLLDRARSAGLLVETDVERPPPELPAATELAVYRIVQEGLTNVLRHAGPGARVRLSIDCSDQRLAVELTDDGGGRIAAPAQRSAGHGLIGMRERVAVHGGSFSAGALLGGGWRISASLPVPGRGARLTSGPATSSAPNTNPATTSAAESDRATDARPGNDTGAVQNISAGADGGAARDRGPANGDSPVSEGGR